MGDVARPRCAPLSWFACHHVGIVFPLFADTQNLLDLPALSKRVDQQLRGYTSMLEPESKALKREIGEKEGLLKAEKAKGDIEPLDKEIAALQRTIAMNDSVFARARAMRYLLDKLGHNG